MCPLNLKFNFSISVFSFHNIPKLNISKETIIVSVCQLPSRIFFVNWYAMIIPNSISKKSIALIFILKKYLFN